MTKAELIERYGIDWYEAHKTKCIEQHKARYKNNTEFREAYKVKSNECHKARYINDPEFREYKNVKDSERNKVSYCKQGEFERIENYELAKADNFKGWDIHHRLELTLDGEYAHSKEDLIRLDMYYNRPYFELIFLTRTEHNKLHAKTRH